MIDHGESKAPLASIFEGRVGAPAFRNQSAGCKLHFMLMSYKSPRGRGAFAPPGPAFRCIQILAAHARAGEAGR